MTGHNSPCTIIAPAPMQYDRSANCIEKETHKNTARDCVMCSFSTSAESAVGRDTSKHNMVCNHNQNDAELEQRNQWNDCVDE